MICWTHLECVTIAIFIIINYNIELLLKFPFRKSELRKMLDRNMGWNLPLR